MASTNFGLERVNSPSLEGYSPSIDLIAVHGLYGSKDISWDEVKWKDEVLPGLTTRSRLSVYTYDVFSSDAGVLTRDGARNEATKLLDSLLELRSKDLEKGAIAFIGHDIGGTLIKERMYRDIYESTSTFIYLGCPHRGSKLELQAGCAEILMSHQGVTFAEAWGFAGSLAAWILDVNHSFAETRMVGLASIFNVDIRRIHYLDGDAYGRHNDPPEPDVTHRKLLRRYLEHGETPLAASSSVLAQRQVAHFVQQTPPRYPLETPQLARDRPRWSSARQEFQSWISAEDNLRLVYAPGDSAIDEAERLYNLYHSLSNDGPISGPVVLFLFDPTDCRYDSAEAMLCTILAELCKQSTSQEERETFERSIASLGICRSHHAEDLYSTLVDMLLHRLASRRDEGSPVAMTLILGNLDGRVQNGPWLFRAIQETVSDCDLNLKVAITSSDPGSLTTDPVFATTRFASGQECAVQESATGTLIDGSGGVLDGPTTVIKDVLALIQSRPQLHDSVSVLRRIASACDGDSKLWKMTVNFFADVQLSNNAQELNSLLSQLITPDITPDKVFKMMLTSAAPQTHSWSTLLLERVVLVFRPLAISEVLDLELFDSSCPSGAPTSGEDLATCAATTKGATERIVSGLLTVKRHEVRLAHPALRDYLLTSKDDALSGWLPLGPRISLIHKDIAQSCLKYLTCPEKRQIMRERADSDSLTGWHTPFERRDNFLSYAVKYWLRHAMRAARDGPSVFDMEVCKGFLEDAEAVGLWAALYLAMSPNLTGREREQGPRRYEDQLASLVIFAEHEAQELLESALNKHRRHQTKGFRLAWSDALIVAAGKGNFTMVKELISIFPLDEDKTLDLAILAAIESGHVEVFDQILGVARKSPENVQDWSRLLARAASLDRISEVKELLVLMEASAKSGLLREMRWSSLIYTCQRGFPEVIELLGEGRFDGSPSWLSEAITSAVKFGRLGDLGSLLSSMTKGLQDEDTVACYNTIFSESSRYGRRKPVQSALRDMKRKLAHTATDPGEGHGTGELLDYIVQTVVARPPLEQHGNYSSNVGAVIREWPRAVDLLDILTLPNDKVTEADFSSTWAMWTERAIESGDLGAVKLVFENGAKWPFATTNVGDLTATRGLRAAMGRPGNGTFCLPYLIEKGADLTTRHFDGRTPLFQAAYMGWVDAAKILIENKDKVDVNAKGDDTWYPIHACYDNVGITRMLVEAGADPDVPTSDEDYPPPIHFSVKWGYEDVVDELLKRPLSRESLKAGLKAAIYENQVKLAEKILKYCPDNSYLPDIDDILHRQVQHSNLKLLEMLLSNQYQLDPDKRDESGKTALHCISSDTPVELIRTLVLRGAKIEATTAARNETSLTFAVRSGNVAAVRYLVQECGALVNVPGGYYGGPFHAACHFGTLEMVKILVHSKADPADINRADPSFMGTPLQAALLRRQETEDKLDIIKYLVLEAKADVNLASAFWGGALHLACLTSATDTMLLLLDEGGADVNVHDHAGRTPLHFALYSTREHAELLLDRGADLTAVDVTKRNAMHFAVLSGRLDLVRFVMEKWSQYAEEKRLGFETKKLSEFVDEEDDHGWTPLLWALRAPSNWRSSTREIKEIVQALLDHGARRLVRGQGIDRTWTPMKMAKYYNLGDDIVSLLKPTPGDFSNMSVADREWGWMNTGTQRGSPDGDVNAFCDHCLLELHGLYYTCSWDKLHDKNHEFELHRVLESDDGLETPYKETTAHVDSSQEGSDHNEEIIEIESHSSEGDEESDDTESSYQ
ncbi:hypothetical protein B0I37DRAFT_351022 [Chaetomium sp. MPI-CAGE-AT-0009]|nr:hypothetical protein B0I37DRAFT_351022 [Chaetomium sp. MPI-CAGE-AT-0009]